MIKRTVVVGSKAFISHKNGQLHISKEDDEPTVPIEDIGVLMLESHQITITQSALSALMTNNVVVIGCDASHHPDGIMMPIAGNVLHQTVLKNQLTASLPLRKQLWAQTVKAKILNQAALLTAQQIEVKQMEYWATKTRTGDPENVEARAAAFYWKNIFRKELKFTREREGLAPNNLLNYGYAILRAAMARAIVSSGLHPALGIHHKNQYNAFCLADDLMEPYRPWVDAKVRAIISADQDFGILDKEAKKQLLAVLSDDVRFNDERKPLLLALTTTTSSLVKCYEKETRQLRYPRFHPAE